MADGIANQGYQVHQNPTPQEVAQARASTGDTGRPDKNPDYLVDGHVFDGYAPTDTKNVRNLWSEVAEKIKDEQTQRVVIDLQGWQGDLAALQKQFLDWPIHSLKEVKIWLPNGSVGNLQLP